MAVNGKPHKTADYTHTVSALHIVKYEYFKVYSQHYQLIVSNRKISVERKVIAHL